MEIFSFNGFLFFVCRILSKVTVVQSRRQFVQNNCCLTDYNIYFGTNQHYNLCNKIFCLCAGTVNEADISTSSCQSFKTFNKTSGT